MIAKREKFDSKKEIPVSSLVAFQCSYKLNSGAQLWSCLIEDKTLKQVKLMLNQELVYKQSTVEKKENLVQKFFQPYRDVRFIKVFIRF